MTHLNMSLENIVKKKVKGHEDGRIKSKKNTNSSDCNTVSNYTNGIW